LLQEGHAHPTARHVAERAGVSLRLVFHHFEDMETLLEAAVAVQAERHWQKLEIVAPEADLQERVSATVSQRARLFEAVAPVRRAAGSAAGSSPTLARQLDSSRSMLRRRLRNTFSAELSMQINGSPCSARDRLDALEVAASFETWDQLRRQSGRSIQATCQIVEHLVLGALGQVETGSLETGNTPQQQMH
jgi:TetR/AcrR family transcriptional regulator of autoinduction and epiphytic fitness